MQSFPHHYSAAADGAAEGTVRVTAGDRIGLDTAPPPEFGGPEGEWSPEHLLVASVADCFVLSFRAVARASRLEWAGLRCDVEAVLDRDDERVTRFVAFSVRPRLTLAADEDRERAEKCLDKAKRHCLITNSLNARVDLEPEIVVAGQSRAATG